MVTPFLVSVVHFFIIIVIVLKIQLKNRLVLFITTLFPAISLLLSLFYLVSDYFTGYGINENVFYHLSAGLSGINLSGFKSVISIVSVAIIGLVLITFLLYIYLIRRKDRKRKGGALYIVVLALLLIHPTSMAFIGEFKQRYVTHTFEKDFDLYYQPLDLEQKKEIDYSYIVLLYLESVEKAYFDDLLFPGLMPNLQKTEQENISFNNIEQLYGTGFTIGGMVASQCGIPLVSYGDSKYLGGTENANTSNVRFLPGANCLGDLFKNNAYHNIYVGGADLKFAGKGHFYQTHGFLKEDIYGRDELDQLIEGIEESNEWGRDDADTLQALYSVYDQAEKNKNTFLVGLTLNTHPPEGLLSSRCTDQYKEQNSQLLDIYHCTDNLIAQFVEKIAKNDKSKETLLILVSDHLSMNNSVYSQLETHPKRVNLFTMLDFKNPKQIQVIKQGSTLDIGATLLDYLGFEDSRVGFGRSLLSKEENNNLFDHLASQEKIDSYLKAWYRPLLKLWGYPSLLEGISVNQKMLIVGGIQYNAPIYIEYDHNYDITYSFSRQYHPREDSKYLLLLNARLMLDERSIYRNNMLIIDRCEFLNSIFRNDLMTESAHQNYCLMHLNFADDYTSLKVKFKELPFDDGEEFEVNMNSLDLLFDHEKVYIYDQYIDMLGIMK